MDSLEEKYWENIPGFPGYQAHPRGEIRATKTKRILRGESLKHPYRFLFICGISTSVHRLVALTFVPNPNFLPQVNHKNGNKRDNNVENLEWISSSGNALHSLSLGQKPGRPNILPVKITWRNGKSKKYDSIIDAANDLGLHKSSVASCLRRDGIYSGNHGKADKSKIWLWKIERVNIEYPKCEEKDITLDRYTHLTAREDGIIFNKKTGKTVGRSDGRYIRVRSQIRNGKTSSKPAHQLIALMFLDNPEGKLYVNHIDGNTENNHVSNLEWCTHSENMSHARRIGLNGKAEDDKKSSKMSMPVYQLELDGTVIREFRSATEASEHMGSKIFSVCLSYKKNVSQPWLNVLKGFGWCYVKDFEAPKINTAYLNLFPELKHAKCVDFEVLRPYVIRKSRPLWQIDIGGNKLKLWNSFQEVVENVPRTSHVRISSTSGFTILSGGYFWRFATYEELIDPVLDNIGVPKIILEALDLPETPGIQLKRRIINLLHSEVLITGKVKYRPFYQFSIDKEIIKLWTNLPKAQKCIGDHSGKLTQILCSKTRMFHGFKWRYLSQQELCVTFIKQV